MIDFTELVSLILGAAGAILVVTLFFMGYVKAPPAENFLNQDTDYIGKVSREVLEGNMREIVGRMKLEEMVSDRQKFAEVEAMA